MPAYSFQERFVPFVKDGSKNHTIRARRRNFAKPGDTLYLYYGMRTKNCMKLREEICTDVRTIMIFKMKTLKASSSIILFDERLYDDEIIYNKKGVYDRTKAPHIYRTLLSTQDAELLAWRDGFRPEGTTLEKPEGSLELMMRFWNQTHELPFVGDIIYWQPK
jgi:hypothetical protein